MASTLVAACLLAASAPAAAAERQPGGASFYLGVDGGYHLVIGDWDIDGHTYVGKKPASSAIFGLRLGVQLSPVWALETNISLIPFDLERTSGSGIALHWAGDLVVSPFAGAWSPHVVLGGGAYQLASGDLGADADWEVHAGLGLRGRLADWVALRVEGRYNLTDSFSPGLAGLLDVTAGFDFFPWGDRAVQPPDGDDDGVADAVDACPSAVGSAATNGCPDGDGDGLGDPSDACPALAGPPEQRGCPDGDRDGVDDGADRCPDVAGDAARDGCPAPPDADGDGVADDQDMCPREAGASWAAGCPDGDRDGVTDRLDKCPTQPGVLEEEGCLPALIKRKFNGPLAGVAFDAGSPTLDPTSGRALDEAAQAFARYPTLRLEVVAYGDDDAPDDAREQLARDRAAVVRDYLVAHGIEPARIVARGSTERGGKKSARRVELTVRGWSAQ
ncbi:MAG: OmpA family protein [Myxococcota bacterium]